VNSQGPSDKAYLDFKDSLDMLSWASDPISHHSGHKHRGKDGVRGKTCFTIPQSLWGVAIYDNGLLMPPDQPSSRNSRARPSQGQGQDLKDLI
jgi:hypothetical protein